MMPNIVTASLVVALGAAVFFRQPRSAVRSALLLLLVCVLFFVLGDLATMVATTIPEKHAALTLLYSGTMWIPTALWLLARSFVQEHGCLPRWAPAWTVRASIAFGAIVWLSAITNPIHGQFLTPVLDGRNPHHWLWHTASGFGYGVSAAASLLCLGLALAPRVQRRTRQQAMILFTGMLGPITANFIYNIWPASWLFDPSVAASGLTVACLAAGVYGLGLFGLSPVSIRAALSIDRNVVFLVDRAGRLLFQNGAAARLLSSEPPGLGARPLLLLAQRLRTGDTDERVSEQALWSLTEEPAKEREGALFRLTRLVPDDDRWLWISASPISSRFRSRAAFCFRAQDVTRLRQSERDRARLEERTLRRRSRAESGPAVLLGLPQEKVDWPSELLERIRDAAEGSSEFGNPSREDVDQLLKQIKRDSTLRRRLERMHPIEVWVEFQRRLGHD